jgi:ABC-2 type transport system permease protein
VSVLPDWLQPVALALPAAHVFEGIRALINDGVFSIGYMVKAFGLNLLYMSLALFLLHRSFQHARRVGSFLQAGE